LPIASSKYDLSILFQNQRFKEEVTNFTRTGCVGSIQTAIFRPIFTRKNISLGLTFGNNITVYSETKDNFEWNNLVNKTSKKGLNFGPELYKTKEALFFNPKLGLNVQINFKTFAITIERDLSLTPTAKYTSEINHRLLYIPSLRAGIAYSLK
jgi:hypothetical protein